MGIEGFFKTLENHTNAGIEKKYNSITDINYLYIDFNSILHIISLSIEKDLAYILYDIIYGTTETTTEILERWDTELNISSYTRITNETNIDNIFISQVKKYIFDLLNTYINKKSIKLIYFAIDGIPTIGKMIEQKQRKYTGFIRSQIIKKIYNLNINSLDQKRKLFEEKKYKFDKNKIVGWSNFMKNIEKNIILWESEIKNIYPNLLDYIISTSDEPGEGEKKIMEHIKSQSGNYMLYSPDADIVPLSIILNNKYQDNSFFVLHYDQDTKSMTFVNIKKFCQFISKYMDPNKTDIINITNDFVVISNLFGNDFLPKISYINVKMDFNKLLKLYSKLDNLYITNGNQINFNGLKKYLELVSEIEDELIREKYIIDNYDSKILKKQPNLIKYFCDYMDKYSNLLNQIGIGSDNYNIDKYVNSLSNEDMIEILSLEYNYKKKSDTKKLFYKFIYYLREKYENGFIRKPFSGIKRKENIQNFHIEKYAGENINYLLIKNGLTDYDKDIILFDWKMGDFKTLLSNMTDDDKKFGEIYYNTKTKKYNFNKINKNKYYSEYLGEANIKNICQEYINGIYWVHEFYFNRNDRKENLKNISVWYYPYHRAPFISDILTYLFEPKKIEYIDFKNYFTMAEQRLYTVPANKLIEDGDKIIFNKYFPDLKKYTDDIWNNNKGYIDCRRVTFFGKCILNKIYNPGFDEFIKMVRT